MRMRFAYIRAEIGSACLGSLVGLHARGLQSHEQLVCRRCDLHLHDGVRSNVDAHQQNEVLTCWLALPLRQ